MLSVQGLEVRVGERSLFRGLDMQVRTGETVILFGPNGSGKTTLLNAIIGIPGYEITSGSIVFKGRDITALPLHERARLGVGLAFQRSASVRGIRLKEALRLIAGAGRREPSKAALAFAERVGLAAFMDRDLNLGFSGGEAKRSELLQLMAQEPELVLFDEPDSGVDLGSMEAVGQAINQLLEKQKPVGERTKAGIIVTHAGYVLDYVNADRAFVLMDGKIYCSGNPRDLLEDIRAHGYKRCRTCMA